MGVERGSGVKWGVKEKKKRGSESMEKWGMRERGSEGGLGVEQGPYIGPALAAMQVEG